MTFKELKLKIKNEQKNRAVKIRILKAARKPHVYNSNPELYDKIGDLDSLRYNYRHVHIAYCMYFNNTEYGDIEKECREAPYIGKIDQYKKEWSYVVEASRDEETICNS